MKLANHIVSRLKKLLVESRIDGKDIIVTIDGVDSRVKLEDGWEDAYSKYDKARSISFNAGSKVFCFNNSVEMLIIRLGINYNQSQYCFTDAKGNSLNVSKCSMLYSLAHFDSDDYEHYFDRLAKRRLNGARTRRISDILWTPNTAAYILKGRKKPANLVEVALKNINNTLFKLSVEQNECYSVWKPSTKKFHLAMFDYYTDDYTIPFANYDDNVVSYYKVAKSSPFASQSYLAYYNVLEYYFLKVSEDLLQHRLKSLINHTQFRSDQSGLDKVISLVRNQDARNDETEMLKNVLDKYISEDELIEFISKLENDYGDKIYSKSKKIFGEQMIISLQSGHTLSNTSKVLKQVRNAIVHSTDRYKREECHIPLSESENIIEEFIPLIRFLAEKIIFGTAT